MMLYGKDPETGKRLDDESIRKQVRNSLYFSWYIWIINYHQFLSFLIAGHETTGGTLCFLIYELLKSPASYNKLRQEIDTILGKERIRYEHISKLPYLIAALRETLRLHPPIPILGLTPFEDTLIGGKHFIEKGTWTIVQLACLHRDPTVWGDDVSLLCSYHFFSICLTE